PYQVNTRWVFYRLFNEGFFKGKDKDSCKTPFLQLISEARNRCYKEWRPDTLADDTRGAIVRGDGFKSELEFLQTISDGGFECKLDRHYVQKYYVVIWIEARAMIAQFEYYTRDITIGAMGGQPSIAYKYETAKALEEAAARYKLPIVVLYFGDCDTGGRRIA